VESFWINNPEKYSEIECESRKYILHPKIRDIIHENNPKRILDYGCGDGSLISGIKEKINISIYDISTKSLSLAIKKYSNRQLNVFYKRSEIPEDSFDVVVFSLVLMTISSKDKIANEFLKIYQTLKENGIVIFGITHPCFRQFKFSSFHTSFSDSEKFNYIDEGKKFQVTLNDPLSTKSISFYDYHWTLSTTLNLIIESGFQIQKVFELPDKSCAESYVNKLIPPYLLIVGKKSK